MTRTNSRFDPVVRNSTFLRVLAGSFLLGWLVEPPTLNDTPANAVVVQMLNTSRVMVRKILLSFRVRLARQVEDSAALQLAVRGWARLRTWFKHSVLGRGVSWWDRTE